MTNNQPELLSPEEMKKVAEDHGVVSYKAVEFAFEACEAQLLKCQSAHKAEIEGLFAELDRQEDERGKVQLRHCDGFGQWHYEVWYVALKEKAKQN